MAYTNIDDPSAYFQVKLWTGNGQTNRTITNDGNSDLQPDMLWAKSRSSVTQHVIYDSTRGAGKELLPNVTNAEGTAATGYNLTGFATDGFITGANQFNLIAGGNEYVAWQWKANAGTTSSNTDGSINTTVQANTDAGFSIVTYTGTGSISTVGHGLGVKPDVMILKNRDTAVNWIVYHKDTDASTNYFLRLNTTDAKSYSGGRFNGTQPTSSVFTVGTSSQTNGSGDGIVAYCFASKQGYSKFGSYVGNGSSDGPFVYTGFKPAFVLIKQTNNPRNWAILDSTRSNSNPITKYLYTDLNIAELTVTSANYVDFLSNGFKVRATGHTTNESGGTYIYMAFAENPFTTSTGIPTTAR